MTATAEAPSPTTTPSTGLQGQVQSTDLIAALSWVRHAIMRRPPVPVLAGVRLTAVAGGLRVSGYDFETHATMQIPGVGIKGEVLVPHALLTAMLRALGRGVTVRLSQTPSGSLALAGDDVEWTLVTMPLDEYPFTPAGPLDPWLTLTGPQLTDLARACRVASGDETLPTLTGVHLTTTWDDGLGLRAYATDRYRMIRTRVPIPIRVADMGVAVLVRAKTLQAVSAGFKADSEIKVDVARGAAIRFTAGNRSLWTRVLDDGNYPKVDSLLPDHATVSVVVDRQLLERAVNRVATVLPRHTPLLLNVAAADRLRIHAGFEGEATADTGVFAERTGPPIVAAFNPEFFFAALASVSTKQVRLAFTEAIKPIVVHPVNDDADLPEDQLQHLLMPVRMPG